MELKGFFKNNWFKVGILIVSLILIFIYFIEINQPTIEVNNLASSDKNLSFDLNLNSLNYQLPPHNLICTPNIKFSCSKDGCEQVKPSVFILIDNVGDKMFRCDSKPCDEYPVKLNASGNFLNVTPEEPNGMIVKISTEGDYFEKVSLGLSTLTSYGTCLEK